MTVLGTIKPSNFPIEVIQGSTFDQDFRWRPTRDTLKNLTFFTGRAKIKVYKSDTSPILSVVSSPVLLGLYIPFRGVVTDISGQDNTVTATNIDYDSGAGVFDGTTYLAITDDTSFDDFTTGATFSFKFKQDSVDAGILFSKSDAGNQYSFKMDASGYLVVTFKNDAAGTYVTTTTNDQSYADGLWHHVVVTLKDDTYMRVYIDGTEKEDETSFTGNWEKSNADDLVIGGKSGGAAADFFIGYIDEVKIFKKEFTAVQVATEYTTSQTDAALTLKGATGEFNLYMSDTITAGFSYDRAVYDIEMIDKNSVVVRLIGGQASLVEEVTD